MKQEGICLISFSDNSDHQEALYSLFDALSLKTKVYTVGIVHPKIKDPPSGTQNYYVDCPKRPGITGKTFRLDVLYKLSRDIKATGVKYVYFISVHIWNILLMLLLPRSIICVEAIHDIVPHNGSFITKEGQRLACYLSSGVVIHNRRGLVDMSRIYGLPREKIQSIPSWRPFPAEKPAPAQRFYLNFGRIRKYKGLDTLLKVTAETPRLAYLVVGSPDEESKPQVEKLKKMANIFVDDREVDTTEMEAYFTKASWVILTYESASQSGVIIDAYRYSRPVIAFDVGALREQVVDGKTGYLVPAGDVEGFIRTLQKADALTRDEYETFCHNAYLQGKRLYCAAQIADDFLQVIGNVRNKHGNSGRGTIKETEE